MLLSIESSEWRTFNLGGGGLREFVNYEKHGQVKTRDAHVFPGHAENFLCPA